jgi:heme A synthase
MAGLAAAVQVGLGITTLLLRVPIVVAVLHQVTGLAVLTAVLVATHRAGSQPVSFTPRPQ